jgi:hypothetical protein
MLSRAKTKNSSLVCWSLQRRLSFLKFAVTQDETRDTPIRIPSSAGLAISAAKTKSIVDHLFPGDRTPARIGIDGFACNA